MLSVVSTGLSNLIAQRALNHANNMVKTSVERLSTGYKINHAADNAANLSIMSSMRAENNGLEKAQENVSQAQDLLSIADSTLAKMTQITERIRELSLQSMNGIYSDIERGYIQNEITQLTQELYRQKNASQYNGINILGENQAGEGLRGGGVTLEVNSISEQEAIDQGYSIIKTADELKALNGNASGKYILMNDIDMKGVDYNSISITLSGEFNGNGYSINNLSIEAERRSLGLFSQIERNGTIKNLSLNNANIINNYNDNDNDNESQSYTGALCGNSYGTIENCTVNGQVKSKSSCCGLLAGNINTFGTVKNCSTSGNVNSRSFAGGLVGSTQRNSSIIKCFSDASVNTTGSKAGGLCGSASGTISDSYATGNVHGSGNVIGGLCGYLNNDIINCYATGDISGAMSTGGLVGYVNNAKITNSFATGNINGGIGSGGLIGKLDNCQVENCYSTGSVTGKASSSRWSIAGFVGICSGTDSSVKSCYSTGDVIGREQIGGFIGNIDGSVEITNNFSSGTVNATEMYKGMFYGKASVSITGENYANNEQPAGISITQDGVEGKAKNWFDDFSNLAFLGDAYILTVIIPN